MTDDQRYARIKEAPCDDGEAASSSRQFGEWSKDGRHDAAGGVSKVE